MEPEGRVIRVGSRKSELALIQTNYVIGCLQKIFPEIKFEIVTMTTLGDRILNVSLPKIGEKSLFTRDLEEALRSGSVDLVVHSLKDLPTALPGGLAVGAVLEREDPRDALVMRDDLRDKSLATLPPGSCVGTSSLRRTAQLHALYPHLRVVDVRGNLNTRLRKLQHYSTTSSHRENTSCTDDTQAVVSDSSSGHREQTDKTNIQQAVISDSSPDHREQTDTTNVQQAVISDISPGHREQTDTTSVLKTVISDGSASNTGDSQSGNGSKDEHNGGSDKGQNGQGSSDGKAPEPQEYAALILAQAGLVRMGWQDRISRVVPCSEMLYAVGQGALAVECRSGDATARALLAPLNHPETYCRVLAERSFLKTLGGGCSAPVGVSTSLKPLENQHRLVISGAVWSLDGSMKVHDKMEQVFPQVRRTDVTKHQLSPTVENECKRPKVDMDVGISENPIEEYNKRISEFLKGSGNINCEDTRSAEETRSLAASQSDIEVSNLTRNVNLNSEVHQKQVESNSEHTHWNVLKKESTGGVIDNVPLYCGLMENPNILSDVIQKCDNLGQELANKLISKGALDVMKISQDYIRSSVKKL